MLINLVLNSIPIYSLSFYKTPAIPIYSFSFYKTPPKVLKEISQISANFLWDDFDIKRIIHWVNWDSMCKAKEDGVLELKTSRFSTRPCFSSGSGGF